MRFSKSVKEIINYSHEEAMRLGNDYINTEHLLLGMIKENDSSAVRLLKSLHIDINELRINIENVLKKTPANPQTSNRTILNIKNFKTNRLSLTTDAENIIQESASEATACKNSKVEVDHLMIAMLGKTSHTYPYIIEQLRKGLQ